MRADKLYRSIVIVVAVAPTRDPETDPLRLAAQLQDVQPRAVAVGGVDKPAVVHLGRWSRGPRGGFSFAPASSAGRVRYASFDDPNGAPSVPSLTITDAIGPPLRNVMTRAKSNTRTISRTLPKKAEIAKLEANAVRACTLLKAMANPTRLIILCQIAHGEKSVGDLAQAVGLRQSGLSQQLALLRHNHLVVARRAGQNIYYSLASHDAASIMETLYDILCRQPLKRAYFDPALRPG